MYFALFFFELYSYRSIGLNCDTIIRLISTLNYLLYCRIFWINSYCTIITVQVFGIYRNFMGIFGALHDRHITAAALSRVMMYRLLQFLDNRVTGQIYRSFNFDSSPFFGLILVIESHKSGCW